MELFLQSNSIIHWIGSLSHVEAEILSTLTNAAALITLLFALADCLAGYRIFRWKCGFVGFIVLGSIGAIVCFTFIEDYRIALVVTCGFAILGAVLGYRIFKLGIFLACFAACFVLFDNWVAPLIGFWPSLVICIVVGIFVGILGMRSARHVIIISSVWTGASVATSSLETLINSQFSDLLTWTITGGLIFLGVIFQYILWKKAS